MEDDLISGLTRQVKEEVIENYLAERRLIELQIEDIGRQAGEMRYRATKTGRRLTRLGHLMTHADMQARLLGILHLPESSFWHACLEGSLSRGIHLIRVRALTDRARFRKLVLESYLRLYEWMGNYRKAYEELQAECRAVNGNISNFHKNFDLLSILRFLRTLDPVAAERKHFLGENFTPEEMASLDQKLYFRPVQFEGLDIPAPLPLPEPEAVEQPLTDLAHEIYRKYQDSVKRLLQ